jgi:hypothetical protein
MQKAQRNLAVLFRTSFTILWRIEIHKNLKIDADTGVALVSAVQYAISIKYSKDCMLATAQASTLYAL